ncbi:MAG TPA: ATP-binding protein, partial [Pseudomonadales bacterium]
TITRDVTDREEALSDRRRYAEQLESQVAERTRDLERTNEQLRSLQSRLIEAERLEATGQLSGQVAHAINNPLMALIGKLQMRIESGGGGDPGADDLLVLARRIESVVRSMLEFSRCEELTLSDIRPDTLLAQVELELRAIWAPRGVEFVTQIDGETPALRADGELLYAALAAIAENAAEASPAGETVELHVGTAAGGRAVEFRIADRGPGIPEALRRQVFEPFFTTKPQGTGLGLAIAWGIVRGHRGRIGIEDRRPCGALVRIHLPAPDAFEPS